MGFRNVIAAAGLGLAVLAAGCKPAPGPTGPAGPAAKDAPAAAAPVVGTWELNVERSKQAFGEWVKTSPRHATEAAQQSAIQEHGVMIGALEAKAAESRLIIKADNTWTSIEPGQPEGGGTWTFDAATGELITTPSGGGTGIKAFYANGELRYMDHGAPMLIFTKE